MAKATDTRLKLVAIRPCELSETYAIGYRFLHCPTQTLSRKPAYDFLLPSGHG